MMDEQIKNALEQDRLIDITTTGRKTGRPHRIEIALYRADGSIYLFGRATPKPKDWYLNLVAKPDFTVHLKQSVQADLKARGVPITDEAARLAIIPLLHQNFADEPIEAFLAGSPVVRVELND